MGIGVVLAQIHTARVGRLHDKAGAIHALLRGKRVVPHVGGIHILECTGNKRLNALLPGGIDIDPRRCHVAIRRGVRCVHQPNILATYLEELRRILIADFAGSLNRRKVPLLGATVVRHISLNI